MKDIGNLPSRPAVMFKPSHVGIKSFLQSSKFTANNFGSKTASVYDMSVAVLKSQPASIITFPLVGTAIFRTLVLYLTLFNNVIFPSASVVPERILALI